MLERTAKGDEVRRDESCELRSLRQSRPCSRKCTGNLVYEHSACYPTTSNLSTLFPADANVITHDNHLHVQSERACFLRCQTEMEDVAGVVHHDQQNAVVGTDPLGDAIVNLLYRGRGEDGARDCGSEDTFADEPTAPLAIRIYRTEVRGNAL